MTTTPSTMLVLLPGMDGTGLLFRDFVAAASAGVETLVIDYPADTALGYAALLGTVLPRLPHGRDYFILAESFSGPLGLMLAADPPPGMLGLMLCCTFAKNPHPGMSMLTPALRLAGFSSLPAMMARMGHGTLFGRFATEASLQALRSALRRVAPAALLERMRAVLQTDVSALLPRVSLPVLYLLAEEDRVIPQSALRHLSGALPHMQLARFAAPHMLLQTAPDAAWKAIQAFVADQGAAVSERKSGHT